METWVRESLEVSSLGRIRRGGEVIAYMRGVKIVQRNRNGEFVGSWKSVDEVPFKRESVLNCLRGRQKYHQGFSFSYV